MQGVKLKRIVDFLWRNPSAAQEKAPILLKKNKVTENGTIAMNRSFSSDDVFKSAGAKKFADDSIESRKEETAQGMSPLRKLCFFLSLNGGVMYFVVLAWLLPCRQWTCSELGQQWQYNLTNAKLTTNLASSEENPSLVVFGYSTDGGNELRALRVSDGTLKWSRPLPAKPNHLFCNFNKLEPGIHRDLPCLITADNFIEVFNAANGQVIWNRNITSDQILSKVIMTHVVENKPYLVGISNDYIHVMDVVNGTELATTQLPCSWTVGVKVAGPWMTKTGYVWALVCEYEDGLEVFTFNEKQLLNFLGKENHLSTRNNVNFQPLFSYQSYSGSIDLASDVTSTPHSLVLSWADMVSMVSAQAPFHHFQKTWERRFSGYLQEVTSISVGHFENVQSTQIAVAVKDNSNSTIHFLDTKNGSTINEAELGSKIVLWMKKIPGLKGRHDKIVIETVDRNNSSVGNKKGNPSTRSYFLLNYDGKNLDMNLLATADEVHDSILIPATKGNSNLLLARTTPDGSSIINRFPIQSRKPKDSTFCKDVKPTSTVLLLE